MLLGTSNTALYLSTLFIEQTHKKATIFTYLKVQQGLMEAQAALRFPTWNYHGNIEESTLAKAASS